MARRQALCSCHDAEWPELVILSHGQWLTVNSPRISPLLNQNAPRSILGFGGCRTDLASTLGDASVRVCAFRDLTSATICSIEGFGRNPFRVSGRLNLAEGRSRGEE